MRKITPSLILAVLAVVFALSGTAVAAHRYLISSTNQVAPKVLKKLHGARGARGATGARGASGAPGQNGTNGTNGADGVNGTNGTNGANGTARAYALVRNNLTLAGPKNIASVTADTGAGGFSPGAYCVNVSPLVPVNQDTNVQISISYSDSSDHAMFAYRTNLFEEPGHCPGNAISVYTGYFVSPATAGAELDRHPAKESFYIAVM